VWAEAAGLVAVIVRSRLIKHGVCRREIEHLTRPVCRSPYPVELMQPDEA
jgi:hypothetical protein